jgi:hypothetical protein
MTVLLSLLANFLSSETIMYEVKESSPDVGSSKKITFGSVMSYTAMHVLFLSPPETPLMTTPPTMVSRHF